MFTVCQFQASLSDKYFHSMEKGEIEIQTLITVELLLLYYFFHLPLIY